MGNISNSLWSIVAALVVLWLLGFFVANLGNLMHLLLVLAVIVLIWNLVTGRRAL